MQFQGQYYLSKLNTRAIPVFKSFLIVDSEIHFAFHENITITFNLQINSQSKIVISKKDSSFEQQNSLGFTSLKKIEQIEKIFSSLNSFTFVKGKNQIRFKSEDSGTDVRIITESEKIKRTELKESRVQRKLERYRQQRLERDEAKRKRVEKLIGLNDECVSCLEKMETQNCVVFKCLRKCEYVMHSSCLAKWGNKCIYCRE